MLAKLLSSAEFTNGQALGINTDQQAPLLGLLTHTPENDNVIDLGGLNPDECPAVSSAITLRFNNVEAKQKLILALQYATVQAITKLMAETAARNRLMDKIAVNF